MEALHKVEEKIKTLEVSILDDPELMKRPLMERLSIYERFQKMVLRHVEVTSKVMSQVDIENFMKAIGLLEIYKKVKEMGPEGVQRVASRVGVEVEVPVEDHE